jgi:hypothetical protein
VDWSFRNHPRCTSKLPNQPVDVCPPEAFGSLPPALFLNRGDGTFAEGSEQAGLKPGKGLGVLILDLDENRKPDIYVANDGVDNFQYLNPGEGRFEEVAAARGVANNDLGRPDGSMGVDAADYDGTGHFSLFVTNFQDQSHALYRNRGQGHFHYAIRMAGITAIGRNWVGFGTGFVDFDRDGALDLFISNGHVVRHPAPPNTVQQRPVLFRNVRTSGKPELTRFEVVSERGGRYFLQDHLGRGVALGDLDNDGATDLVISHSNDPVVLLKNNDTTGHHWLGIALIGRPNRDAIGAKLLLEVKGQKLVRAVKGGGSYLSANDSRLLFGLGTAERVDRLTVQWPSGKTQTWPGSSLTVDSYWRLTEGDDGTVQVR